MRKSRVLANVENRRIVPGTFIKYLCTVLLFLFLLPYVITTVFKNIENDNYTAGSAMEMMTGETNSLQSIYVENSTAAGSERIPLEIYLVDKLSRTVAGEYEPETLNAQAVLLRTALIEQLWSETGTVRGVIALQDEEYGHTVAEAVFVQAVYDTQGVFLTYQDTPAKAPYFAVSSGKTRTGSEVLGTEDYPYLKSVSCDKDFLSEQFTAKKTIRKSEFEDAWEKATGKTLTEGIDIDDLQITRDSSDYITGVACQDTTLSGEECRIIWGLDSACFKIEEEKQKVTFTVKGIGHGLGMSQFAANEMAKSNSDYIKILDYFFPGTQLTKIE